jgi:tRNA pseudouridine38-40 synthase
LYLKLRIQYDGTDFSGSQLQAEGRGRTVQGELEAAIARLAGEAVRANLAGRTDAGVHAWGQVASLDFPQRPRLDTPKAVKRALNGILPDDVAVLEAEEVDETFHARFSAIWRSYRYLIVNQPEPLPLLRRYSLHVPQPLNVPAMREAVALLKGEHDFAAFAGQGMGVPFEDAEGSERPSTVRHMSRADVGVMKSTANYWSFTAPGRVVSEGAWEYENTLVAVDFKANAFLPQMIRTIVGTLLEVGYGKRTVDGFRQVLESRDRRKAGPTAKPQGLCLLWVAY